MTKKDFINGCIDMSYNVSKEEMEKAVKEVSGQLRMEIKLPVKVWKELYERLETITPGENGYKVLFCGSNAEAYRQ